MTAVLKVLAANGAQEVVTQMPPPVPQDGSVAGKKKQSRMLTSADLKNVKGISYSPVHIGRLEKMGKFPRHFKLNPRSRGRNFWWEHEVDEWRREAADARDLKKV